MPEAFGKYLNNLVLREEVCADCNQTLGREVETTAARGSLEGVHRFMSGRLQSLSSFLKLPRNRVSMEIDEPGWEGVRAYQVASPDGTEPMVLFEPQVLIDLKQGGYRSYTLEELARVQIEKEEVQGYRLYALSDDQVHQLVEQLRRSGVDVKMEGTISNPPSKDGKVKVLYGAIYDLQVRRLMAKIAFNYVAYQLGAPFALKSEFDAIRAFIRHGVDDGSGLAEVEPQPLLFDEQDGARWQRTGAHFVAVDRGRPDGLLGHVSLFNLLHHRIVLARRNPEMISTPAIPSGHLHMASLSWPARCQHETFVRRRNSSKAASAN